MKQSAITKDCLVMVHYVLRDENGVELDASEEGKPLSYLHGHHQIVPGLEGPLEGKEAGDVVRVQVPPEQGYGAHDPTRILEVDRSRFEFLVEPGMLVRAELADGKGQVFLITEVTEETVTLDGNHPLAGKHLDFEVTVQSVRAATEREIEEAREAAEPVH